MAAAITNRRSTVSGFLQRMGRTGRRAGTRASTTFFCEDNDAVLQAVAFIELAREHGIPVEERPVPLEEMRAADEIFFTGTTTEVRPTVRLDDQPVGNGKVGPVAKALYEAFQAGTRA